MDRLHQQIELAKLRNSQRSEGSCRPYEDVMNASGQYPAAVHLAPIRSVVDILNMDGASAGSFL